jgi:hypothetical protein
VVIGQDCWERDESAVEPFIKQMGEKMTYRVALDDKSDGGKGKMAVTWMEAAGQNGIPSAFLINKEGVIAWIGHPMQLKEEMIEQVLAGTFDVKKAAAEAEAMSKNQAQLMKLSQALSAAMKDKKWDEAEAALNDIEKLLPEARRSSAAFARMNVLISKGDGKAACKLAGEISEGNLDNAMMQNQLAWTLLTNKELKDPDLALAEKIAVRGNDAAKGKDPGIMDTLARAYFANGKKDKAIEVQEKAISLADENTRPQLTKTLESYKAGKLPAAEE